MNSTENFMHNELSWKSFLSTAAKDIKEYNHIKSWIIMSKYQLAFTKKIEEPDLEYLVNNYNKFSTFYMCKEEIALLSKYYDVSESKDNSIVIPVLNMDFTGRHFHDIRNCINRNTKAGYELLDDYKKYDDVLKMLNRWDDTSGEKHFQSRAGKNKYFFKNNFHKDGISLFIYNKEDLIAFGILSKPDINGTSSYIIGKSLCYDYKGLSEYADVELYKKSLQYGTKEVNLGGGKNTVVDYKNKFPNSYEIPSYDIKCKKIGWVEEVKEKKIKVEKSNKADIIEEVQTEIILGEGI